MSVSCTADQAVRFNYSTRSGWLQKALMSVSCKSAGNYEDKHRMNCDDTMADNH